MSAWSKISFKVRADLRSEIQSNKLSKLARFGAANKSAAIHEHGQQTNPLSL